MVFTYIGSAATDANNTGGTVTIAKPVNVQNGDFMLALLYGYQNVGGHVGLCAGWNTIYQAECPVNTSLCYHAAWKIANGEPASYGWGFPSPSNNRAGGTILHWRDGFNVNNPIDELSWGYNLNGYDDQVTIAGIDVSAVDSALIAWVHCQAYPTRNSSVPSLPVGFSEKYDFGSDGSYHSRAVSSMVWAGSGATGNPMWDWSGTIGGYSFAGILSLNPIPPYVPRIRGRSCAWLF